MHMADALLSPTVGATLWAATSGTIVYCSYKLKNRLEDAKIPLMGVLGAFVFAAQMINFTIPGTGSSGHLGGGLLLAVLLGPHAAFLAMASVLTVQALFFADGGLLALGCNIFNLGVFPCLIAYPLIYTKIVGPKPNPGRLLIGSLLAAVVGLQLGSLSVVLETTLSGISELPFFSFLMLMQPIHLVIGVVEGIVTTGVITFIWKAQPEILQNAVADELLNRRSSGKILASLVAATIVIGGVLAWFASEHPDGLEWSILHLSGKEELKAPSRGIHDSLEHLQEQTAFMPNYTFKEKTGDNEHAANQDVTASPVNPGTSAAGLVGGLLVMGLGLLIGIMLKKKGHSTT
jgi:cobalt/nickel transport system permease protein